MKRSTKPKSIVAIWHAANKGKTEILRELARLLTQRFPSCQPLYPIPFTTIPQTGDFRFVANINGRIVAVESQGDPSTNLQGRLLEIVNRYGAEVIFCSTRTKGDTVDAVENLQSTCGFEAIWTSSYQINHNRNLVNQLKAKHIIDLVQQLSIL